jgi:hypothetical protein
MTEQLHTDVVAAADFFNQTAKKLLTQDGRLHAETLIASVARMAGSLMYRTFGFDKNIQPGTSVLSDQANIHGPILMNMMLVTMQQLGDQITETDLTADNAPARLSQLTFMESHERLAPFFLKYCEVTPLGLRPAAIAASVATGMLVHECAAALPIRSGAAIAVFGFVEGTKTAPRLVGQTARSGNRPKPGSHKKPWYKPW